MDGYAVYMFLGFFLVLSVLMYANYLVVQLFGLRFGWNDKQTETIMHAMLVLSLSFLWYSISLSFTLYNKWLLQQWQTGFHFPIIITTVHMTIKYLITRVWALTPDAEDVPNVPWKVLSSVIIPIGVCTSADIVFANIAIYYLPLSMYTAVKGATTVFTFALGVLCGVENFRWTLFIAVLGIAGGLGLAIAHSTEALSPLGLVCVALSACCSAVRWVLVQLLADRDEHSSSVMVTLYRFSPYSALSIIPFALALEAPALMHSAFAHRPVTLLEALMYCVVGGLVSFFLIIAEVKLLRVTSSLTMCVIGQIKEVIQIGAAMVLYQDQISLRSGLGILVSIVAAYGYRVVKSAERAEEEAQDERAATLQILQSSDLAHRGIEGLGLLGSGSTRSSGRSSRAEGRGRDRSRGRYHRVENGGSGGGDRRSADGGGGGNGQSGVGGDSSYEEGGSDDGDGGMEEGEALLYERSIRKGYLNAGVGTGSAGAAASGGVDQHRPVEVEMTGLVSPTTGIAGSSGRDREEPA